jgi:CPA1 family monovalent cation:H+ antiporter
MHAIATFGTHERLQLLALFVAVAALLCLAPISRIPYPILLVLGGLALGFVPGLPNVELRPDVVLVAILPPLLYYAAFSTSLRDLRANARPIALLSLGLVTATTVGVAAIAHAAIAGLPWSSAFVLGAVVSPTDPIAATSVAGRLGVPRRLISIIEGESLVNDASALVLYRFAVIAVTTGTFSLWHAGLRFVVNVAGGLAIGLAVGYVVRRVRRQLNHSPVEITLALLTGYFAYLPADAAGVSAVVAVVTAGVYVGWYTPELTTVETRLQGGAFWEILAFLLNSLLFVLVGLQLPHILDELAGRTSAELALDALLVSAAVIVIRAVWIFPATYLPRWMFRRIRERDPYPPWQAPALLAWTGMRGALSLAAALALPLTTKGGEPFPGRNLIVFLTFTVILATLVVQGLTIPAVVRLLGLEDDRIGEREEAKARIHAADAALERLEELVEEDWVREDTAERMRGSYGFRRNRFAARFDDGDDGEIEERSANYQRLRRELLEAERRALVQLRNEGRINDEVMRKVERDLDLEDSRLDY